VEEEEEKVTKLDEWREDLLDLISELEVEATDIFIMYALEKLVLIFRNILEKPDEEKYRIIKLDNKVFYSNIGRF